MCMKNNIIYNDVIIRYGCLIIPIIIYIRSTPQMRHCRTCFQSQSREKPFMNTLKFAAEERLILLGGQLQRLTQQLLYYEQTEHTLTC